MTEWFDRERGDDGPLTKVTEDGDVMIVSIYDNVPDWVRSPPELGGQKIKVVAGFTANCPKCGLEDIQHLGLENKYGVAKCHDRCGYVWYSKGAVS